MTSRLLPSRTRAVAVCVSTVISALLCAVLLVVAVVAPAPLAALPFIIAICVGCPVLAGWELATSVAAARAASGSDVAARSFLDARAVDDLRRKLDELPETRHPLGL